MELDFRVRVDAVASATHTERSHVVDECWARALTTEDRWLERIEVTTCRDVADYASAWDEMNRTAGIDPSDALRVARSAAAADAD